MLLTKNSGTGSTVPDFRGGDFEYCLDCSVSSLMCAGPKK